MSYLINSPTLTGSSSIYSDKAFSSLEQEKIANLYARYNAYIHQFLPLYKQHLLREYIEVKKEFPNIDFDVSIRIKSKRSYEQKVIRKLQEGKTGNVYDTFANKFILFSKNGQSDESTLEKACYEVRDFLVSYNKNLEELPDKRKDYIATPKESGYQSEHITRNHDYGSFHFFSETQIKTFRMRERELFGAASHAILYKDRGSILNNPSEIKNSTPKYLSIVTNKSENSCKIYELSFEQCFEHFFGMAYTDYKKKYKEEQDMER